MFLRLICVAYRCISFHWWVMFRCMRIYVSFLLLMDICFQYFAETDSDTVTIPGACVCSLSAYTPGGGPNPRVCASSVWLNTVIPSHLQSGFPSLLSWQFCLLHILRTMVSSDLRLYTNVLEAQWYRTWFWFASSWLLVGWASFHALMDHSPFSFSEKMA